MLHGLVLHGLILHGVFHGLVGHGLVAHCAEIHAETIVVGWNLDIVVDGEELRKIELLEAFRILATG